MDIITRFAPSPTGFLHIGGARTAFFNFLFARHHKGKFFLRVEDTDKLRSTEEAKNAILSGMKWLGMDWDGEVVFQSLRQARHREVAEQLLEAGKAYRCFCTPEEVEDQKHVSNIEGRNFVFKSPWRDKDYKNSSADQPYVVRLKVANEGTTIVHDLLQGEVVFDNNHIEDLVLLRSDGTPTYMLAVVVDDHDMGVTHIIRGDDHLTNAAKQIIIYESLSWKVPYMAHVPMIHGPDGAKLSKRHGALNVEIYKDMGYLPEALCNYLLRLGWSHGDTEIISREEAIEWFNLDNLGKSPSKIDFMKLKNLNGHYIRCANNHRLFELVFDILKGQQIKLSEQSKNFILQGMESLKLRANLLTELSEMSKIYIVEKEIQISPSAIELIKQNQTNLISQVVNFLDNLQEYSKDSIQAGFKQLAEANDMKLGKLIEPVRLLLTGSTNSVSVFEIISIIGKEHTISRLLKGEA